MHPKKNKQFPRICVVVCLFVPFLYVFFYGFLIFHSFYDRALFWVLTFNLLFIRALNGHCNFKLISLNHSYIPCINKTRKLFNNIFIEQTTCIKYTYWREHPDSAAKTTNGTTTQTKHKISNENKSLQYIFRLHFKQNWRDFILKFFSMKFKM